ncbi:unnamed protein product [Cochlearia groenlandica]
MGADDPMVQARKFEGGLRDLIQGRLQDFRCRDYHDVVKTAANLEKGFIKEQRELRDVYGYGPKSNQEGRERKQGDYRRSMMGERPGDIQGNKCEGSRSMTSSSSSKCYACNTSGHYAKDCLYGLSKPPPRPITDVVYFICKERGHYSSNCPTKDPMIKGKQAKVDSHPASSRSNKSASKKQATNPKIHALDLDLDLDNHNLPYPHLGPHPDSGRKGYYLKEAAMERHENQEVNERLPMPKTEDTQK